MTEMQGALGRIQLARLPVGIEARRRNAEVWRAALAGLPAVRCPRPGEHSLHSYYKFYAFIEPDQLRPGATRDGVLAAVEGRGIPCGVGSCSEIYLERAFRDRGWSPAEPLPVARELAQTSMMFQVHPTLDPDELSKAAAAVRQIISESSRTAIDTGRDARQRAA
jgi:dTDP-4-amino-4,6-dideoxygalactose transaminase